MNNLRVCPKVSRGLRFRMGNGEMVVTTGRSAPLFYHVLHSPLFKHEVRVIGTKRIFFADLDQFDALSVSPWPYAETQNPAVAKKTHISQRFVFLGMIVLVFFLI